MIEKDSWHQPLASTDKCTSDMYTCMHHTHIHNMIIKIMLAEIRKMTKSKDDQFLNFSLFAFNIVWTMTTIIEAQNS